MWTFFTKTLLTPLLKKLLAFPSLGLSQHITPPPPISPLSFLLQRMRGIWPFSLSIHAVVSLPPPISCGFTHLLSFLDYFLLFFTPFFPPNSTQSLALLYCQPWICVELLFVGAKTWDTYSTKSRGSIRSWRPGGSRVSRGARFTISATRTKAPLKKTERVKINLKNT